MEIETRREGARPSPFSRPPQPKPASTFGSGPAASSGVTTGAISPSRGQTAQTDATPAIVAAGERQALEARRRSGGQWFYWVAGLSLINTALTLAGQSWRFILGLGVTQLVQELGQQSPGGNMKAGLVGLVVIGLFAFLGQRAIRGDRWAFVVGMVLYALDGVIFLLISDWLGVGFHAFALMMILRGYSAARRLPSPRP
jgi:hypothetical protein